MKLTITSETGTVTIRYKMRDKFQFLVGAGLTLKNIIFDASDSVMTPSIDTFGCLANPNTVCCSVVGSSLSGAQCTGFVR